MTPSGHVLDFVEYGGTIPLPEECPFDEWAGIHATVRIQLLDAVDDVTNVYIGARGKRPRNDEPSSAANQQQPS